MRPHLGTAQGQSSWQWSGACYLGGRRFARMLTYASVTEQVSGVCPGTHKRQGRDWADFHNKTLVSKSKFRSSAELLVAGGVMTCQGDRPEGLLSSTAGSLLLLLA